MSDRITCSANCDGGYSTLADSDDARVCEVCAGSGLATVVIHISERRDGDVYIGRAGKGEDGYFGNPIKVGSGRCPSCKHVHHRPGDTLLCYRTYFLNRVMTDEVFRERINNLRGRRLVCFCKPNPCHGDVIVEWLQSGA